jgi:hypothetical protein
VGSITLGITGKSFHADGFKAGVLMIVFGVDVGAMGGVVVVSGFDERVGEGTAAVPGKGVVIGMGKN